MSQTLEMNVELVSPAKSLAKVKAAKLQVPGRDGYLGILPGHAALVTELGLGELLVEGPSIQPMKLLVNGGYMEVVNDQVIVLVDAAESKLEIDVARAQKARERALERLGSKDPAIDAARAQLALARANARIAFAGK
jgi:F-type H+-transporting ATPase subunit epsilon